MTNRNMNAKQDEDQECSDRRKVGAVRGLEVEVGLSLGGRLAVVALIQRCVGAHGLDALQRTGLGLVPAP